jgi:hypothetical protein
MKQLTAAISKQKPIVLWNPYKENDKLTRDEFIALVKAFGYKKVIYNGNWITAYLRADMLEGYESIQFYIKEASEMQLPIYKFILQDDLLLRSTEERDLFWY